MLSLSAEEQRTAIHPCTPLHRHRASSPEQLSHLQREAFHMKFITSPLAVHPSKPLFVRRNLGILQNR